eukprot:768883-Pyramimonas_sp.AAC.1
MQNSELEPCLHCAHRLVELDISDDSTDAAKAESFKLIAFLRPRLRLIQGVPVGLGSGRGSLAHKLHALTHATRLTSASWADAVF